MEQTNLFEFLNQKFKIDKPIRLIEFFAGVGSQAMALKELGYPFEHYKVVEFDKYAIQSYNAIHGTSFMTSDIRQITSKDLDIVNKDEFTYLLTYSFPCQDLSKAGNKRGMSKGSKTRSGLLWEVERILCELNSMNQLPQVLLMENVPDVIGTKNIKDFNLWQTSLEKLGYSNYVKVLNAKDFGIPQNRARCFMISILGNYYYEFPKGVPLEFKIKDFLEKEVDDKYYLSQKNIDHLTDMTNINGYVRGEKFIPHDETSKYVWTITTSHRRSATDIYFIEKEHKEHTKVFLPNREEAVHLRMPTPLECWRLMGFSDEDYYKAKNVGMSNTQLYKQAGNSIVKQVLIAIFKKLI